MQSNSELLTSLLTKHEKEQPNRVPPHNYDAENAVLGSVLLNDGVLDEIMEYVDWSDFYRPSNQLIFRTMTEMRARGDRIDPITLSSSLEARGLTERAGGKLHLLDLADAVVIVHNAVEYAKIIRDLSKMRQLIEIGVTLQARGFDANVDEIDFAIGEAVSLTTALAMSHQTVSVDVGTVFETLIREMRDGAKHYITPPGLGFARIRPGDLAVVAAGTGVGKTALTLNWVDEWSKYKTCVYYEYEMPESDLLARLICKHAGVTMSQIQDVNFTEEEMQRVNDAGIMLRSRKLKIEELWCDVGTLMAKIRREAQQGAEVVVIDHLGLIPLGKIPAGINHAKAVGLIVTNPLKRLAAELGISIVLLVQLNREGQRSEHFPKLYHLRDSGEIEQDASLVFMCWSDQDADTSRRTQVREDSGILSEEEIYSSAFRFIRVGVEKNRNGRLGESYLLFYGENFRYESRYEEDNIITIPKLFHEGA